MFFRKNPERKPEPTEEQLREEEEFTRRNQVPENSKRVKSITTETQEIVQNTLDELDKAIREKRRVKEAAKQVQKSCSVVGQTLKLQKA